MIAAILVSTLVTALVLMRAFPKTPTGKKIRRALIEAPAQFLHDLTWARVGKLALSGAALMLMMFMGPEMLMLMAAMGLDAAFVEVLIVVWFASASGGLAAGWRSVARFSRGLAQIAKSAPARLRRPRAPRRPKSRPQGRKDDADRPEWAFA